MASHVEPDDVQPYVVHVQERAERDVAEAFAYIYDQAPEPALRWYWALSAAIESLSDYPNRCPRAPESEKLGFDLRHLIFGKRSGAYRILFLINDSPREVNVVSVRHGARGPVDANDID